MDNPFYEQGLKAILYNIIFRLIGVQFQYKTKCVEDNINILYVSTGVQIPSRQPQDAFLSHERVVPVRVPRGVPLHERRLVRCTATQGRRPAVSLLRYVPYTLCKFNLEPCDDGLRIYSVTIPWVSQEPAKIANYAGQHNYRQKE